MFKKVKHPHYKLLTFVCFLQSYKRGNSFNKIKKPFKDSMTYYRFVYAVLPIQKLLYPR